MAVTATPQSALRYGTLVLLLLLMALAAAHTCLHLQHHHDTFPWDSLQLLQDMAPSPTQPCQHQQAPIFPDALLHTTHPQQAAAIALRILQHLFDTFSSPSAPQHWDTQGRHELLNNLQHYIHRLEQCLLANSMLIKTQRPRNLLLSVNRYFMDIQEFLHTHSYSACAWDQIRLQARTCFQNMDMLIRKMKSQDTPAATKPVHTQTLITSQQQQPQSNQRQRQKQSKLSTSQTSSRQVPTPTTKEA